jgi:hypothetical protein
LGRNGTENWVKDSIHRNAEWVQLTHCCRMRLAASEQRNHEMADTGFGAPQGILFHAEQSASLCTCSINKLERYD